MNGTQWDTLVGALMPVLVSVVVQTHWSTRTKALAAVGLCILAGLGSCYATGRLDPKDVVGSILTILVAAKAVYEAFWKPTGLAPSLEKATSIPPAPEGDGKRGE